MHCLRMLARAASDLLKPKKFDNAVRAHLVTTRNTPVAHDELESIEPRVLQLCLSIIPSGFSIPVSVAVPAPYATDAARSRLLTVLSKCDKRER